MITTGTYLAAKAFLVAACTIPFAPIGSAGAAQTYRGATEPLLALRSTKRSSATCGFEIMTSQGELPSDSNAYTLQQGVAWRLAELTAVVSISPSEIQPIRGVVANPTELSSAVVKLLASVADRATTDKELAIAEIRSWTLLDADWDGEGALLPNPRSLVEASSFVCSLPAKVEMPEPMLHSTGRASLFWRSEGFYAHLEFLGDERVAYYIERGADKHKGVVGVAAGEMSPLLLDLLPSQRVMA